MDLSIQSLLQAAYSQLQHPTAPGQENHETLHFYPIICTVSQRGLRSDFSQSRDLAKQEQQRLARLKALFDREAQQRQVFPLDDREFYQRAIASQTMTGIAKQHVYWGA